jgi:hypothetical protein
VLLQLKSNEFPILFLVTSTGIPIFYWYVNTRVVATDGIVCVDATVFFFVTQSPHDRYLYGHGSKCGHTSLDREIYTEREREIERDNIYMNIMNIHTYAYMTYAYNAHRHHVPFHPHDTPFNKRPWCDA